MEDCAAPIIMLCESFLKIGPQEGPFSGSHFFITRISKMDSPYLITNAEVTSVLGSHAPEFIIDNSFNIDYYRTTVQQKILTYSAIYPKTHIIPSGKFKQVYVTSDLHADFRKFVQILKQFGLISTALNPYTADIYSPELIGEAKWIAPPHTLLVIVGDLVDGKRNHGPFWNSSDDIEGAFEFRIHALIYNLRIKARENNSDVFITIGNHDYETVIRTPPSTQFIDKYVHDTAQDFFGLDRREALLPFYLVNPYFFVSIEGENKEAAFVHGGLHSNVPDLLEKLTQFQIIVNGESVANLPNRLNSYNKIDNTWGGKFGESDAIWSRSYAVNDSCAIAKTSRYHYIIVGHCPTNYGPSFPRIQSLIKKRPECDDGILDSEKKLGCVIMDCIHDKTKIAFVDTGMSKAFRLPTEFMRTLPPGNSEIDNEQRPVEILKLVHDRDDSDSYYNKALTIHMNSAGSIVENVYYEDMSKKVVNLVANFVGGKTCKRKSKRKNKSLKKRTLRRNRRS